MFFFSASSTGMPHSRTVPADGFTKPMIALKMVDLPLPLTPTSAQMVPGSSSKLASRTAVKPFG